MVKSDKKIRIGLFLNSNQTSGGTFQYNLTILNSLKKLDPDIYQIVLIYTNKYWENYATQHTLLFKVNLGITFRIFAKICFGLKLNLTTSRFIGKIISPIRKINNSNCDLIIYPSQDNLSYLAGAKSVVAIHDLMHRYEPKFQEYKDGEYERREYHYKMICRSSNVILVDSNIGKTHVIESYFVNVDKVKPLPFIPPYYFDSCQEVDIHILYFILPVSGSIKIILIY